MARQENIDAVIAAIDTVYRACGDKRPQKADIIASAGVSHKTFYRVLSEHPEVKRQLDLAEAVFDRRPDADEPSSSDPLKANPADAIAELLDTIAKLTEVIESQRNHIGDLEHQLGIAPVNLTDRDSRRRSDEDETDTPRRLWRDRSGLARV